MKTEVVPAASNKSNPTNAARKLLTGVVGPFRAWKPPLGTCRKNRSVTSPMNPKNNNLSCRTLITSNLPSPAGVSNKGSLCRGVLSGIGGWHGCPCRISARPEP